VGGGHADEPLPIVVLIHGRGDRPESWASFAEAIPRAARDILPRAPIPFPTMREGSSWFDYPGKNPAELARDIAAVADRIDALVHAVAAMHPTRGKAVVAGFSQGGFLSFVLAFRHSETFAAAFPMSGGVPPALLPDVVPPHAATIFAIHGDADDLVPIGPTRDAITHLKSIGYPVEFREYRGVHHQVTMGMQKEILARIAHSLETPP
jgi:phospholipase/carboxylesterase